MVCFRMPNSVVSNLKIIKIRKVPLRILPLKNNSVDKTDGFQLYLSLESLDADIVTAKVSEVGFKS